MLSYDINETQNALKAALWKSENETIFKGAHSTFVLFDQNSLTIVISMTLPDVFQMPQNS